MGYPVPNVTQFYTHLDKMTSSSLNTCVNVQRALLTCSQEIRLLLNWHYFSCKSGVRKTERFKKNTLSLLVSLEMFNCCF